ncbi:MAG TPA: hydrogen peroxide-dependent heme synthase [Acidobacteriaceae bacterium]
MSDTPAVPLTLEGSLMLHQFFRFNWKAWRALSPVEQERISTTAIAKLREIATPHVVGETNPTSHQTVLFSQLGHKGDLMLIHLRNSIDDLAQIELALAQTEFHDYLTQTHSYLSAVELGLYESSAKTYSALAARDIQPHSPEWNAEIKQTLDRQGAAMASRLFPAIPDHKYACFYPMDRKRSDQVNWYTEPMADRQRMMHEHGLIGRRYADEVRQIISGSIGLDDWEWGVDLFSNDPLVFKRLIYEMRFDEVSAKYALFGSFYVGIRLDFDHLTQWLSGSLT